MAKTKQSPPEKIPDVIKSGELFIRETYLRLHRQKREFSTEQANEKLEREIKSGSVVIHGNRGEIKIFKKV
jgi:hypothetical protein